MPFWASLFIFGGIQMAEVQPEGTKEMWMIYLMIAIGFLAIIILQALASSSA